MIELRLPQFNAQSEKEQIKQIQDYLFQIIRQINLNFANKNSNDEGAEGKGDTYNYVVKRTTNITNVEDDDEEVVVPSVTETGTWTPKVEVGCGDFAPTLDANTYTKVGKLVFVAMSGMYVPPSSSSEEFRIYGDELPSPMKGRGFGVITNSYLQFFTDSTKETPCANVSVELMTSGGRNCIRFKKWVDGRAPLPVYCNEVALNHGGAIDISAVYQTEE